MRGLVRQHSHHTQFARAESAAAVTEILSGPGPPKLLDHRAGLDPPIRHSQLFVVQPLKINPFGLESWAPDSAPAGLDLPTVPGRHPKLRTLICGARPESDATHMAVQGRAMRGSHGTVATQDAGFDTCGFPHLEGMRPRPCRAR